ncbi:MAG: L-aspartate oxidase [Bacillota bacterium]
MSRRYLVNFDTRQLPQEEWDYVILGSGIAGLYTAYTAGRQGAGVVVLTKHTVLDSNTDKAQGGIAAALGKDDSPHLHLEDTLSAGAGLCDEEAVQILVNEGPRRVKELIALGARFDSRNGELSLGREGAHSRHRVLHAGGDATGAEIQRILTERTADLPCVSVLESHFAVDLLVREGACYGVLVYAVEERRLKVFWGRAVVLATGGLGQLYEHTTNPAVATGDGVAMAYRAGAEVMDMEFVQFHPTVLNLPGAPRFLISEAVRGEGGVLRNCRGERFMPRYHELAELAPRDVVVRAILKEMNETGTETVFLDVSHLDQEKVAERFPTIYRTCREWGLNPASEPIPVAPAAHYMMGGVKTNLHGETGISGLYACGEAACAGVHGANRLASNSLLDGLVFGRRIVDHSRICRRRRKVAAGEFGCSRLKGPADVDYEELRRSLRRVMQTCVGAVREEDGLREAFAFFQKWARLFEHSADGWDKMEVHNMLEVGRLITQAALFRPESRGGHYRLDYPEPVREWQKHILFKE